VSPEEWLEREAWQVRWFGRMPQARKERKNRKWLESHEGNTALELYTSSYG
jgi:hypothetical protein